MQIRGVETIENVRMNHEPRNYGIDLLRVLTTIMVIVLHLLLYGGIHETLEPLSGSYNLMWFLAIAADCAVNCFALITGFVSYGRKTRYINILRLHLTVLFYTLGITGIIQCFSPDLVENYVKLQSILPILSGTYWYYSVYAILFFLLPILNLLMKKLSKRYTNIILFVGILLFSVLPTVSGQDYFAINRGFSLPWLTLVSFIGMYLKKYQKELYHNKRGLIALYFGCVGLTWILKLALELWSYIRIGHTMDTSMLIDYCSPTILFAAIALVLLFSSLQIPTWKIKILSCLAPLSFSTYIIHEHPLIRRLVIRNSMLFAVEFPGVVLLGIVLSSAILIWLTCSCLDWVRKWLFDVLYIEKSLRFLEKKIQLCRK